MAESNPADPSETANLEVDRIDSSRCSMDSLITSDSSSDDLVLAEAGSEDSRDLYCPGDSRELGKVVYASSSTAPDSKGSGDVQCGRSREDINGHAVSNPCTEVKTNKLANTSEGELDQEGTNLESIKKREESEDTVIKKRKRSRERKISVCSDHSTFIAGVKVCLFVQSMIQWPMISSNIEQTLYPMGMTH